MRRRGLGEDKLELLTSRDLASIICRALGPERDEPEHQDAGGVHGPPAQRDNHRAAGARGRGGYADKQSTGVEFPPPPPPPFFCMSPHAQGKACSNLVSSACPQRPSCEGFPTQKRKTAVEKETSSPLWNQLFYFDDVEVAEGELEAGLIRYCPPRHRHALADSIDLLTCHPTT